MKLIHLFSGWLFLSLTFCTTATWAQADRFGGHIKNTEPLSAQEQLKTFHLPAGFEIQLVADEPEVRKPINITFDPQGRLYATQSTEYPYPNFDPTTSKDCVSRYEIDSKSGRAKSAKQVVNGLAIPIGITPIPVTSTQNDLLVFSIPNLYRWRDTDGDGVYDEKQAILTGFGQKDTHGLVNGLTYWIDGWVYACHGFSNESDVTGTDGSKIKMQSGNTFRFKPDGSKLEQFTWGQVNPFGMAFDPYGNIFTADCHTLPAYQILRGAYYPSFGKPHDGLGYGPAMMKHQHGSTGISGIVYYEADQFPSEYRGSLFIGNPITARVNHDKLKWHGSTPEAIEQPDFIVCDDPWFRPVDLKLGPDGALYIADFYNRIIGHYEVPLDHPQRDRERGRIWRVVYKGDGAKPAEIVHVSPDLNRNHNLDSVLSKTQRMKMLAEQSVKEWDQETYEIVRTALSNSSAFVVRSAADALGQHPLKENLAPLLAAWSRTPAEDTHLIHTIRMALRDHLLVEGMYASLADTIKKNADLERRAADISLGVRTPKAAQFLLDYLQQTEKPLLDVPAAVEHVVRYVTNEKMPDLWGVFAAIPSRAGVDAGLVLRAAHRGLQARGEAVPQPLVEWTEKTAAADLKSRNVDQVKAGLELVRDLKWKPQQSRVTEFVAANSPFANLRVTAVEALVACDGVGSLDTLARLLSVEEQDAAVRAKALQSLGGINHDRARDLLLQQLLAAPEKIQLNIANALLGTPQGSDLLLKSIEAGKAASWLLTDANIVRRLRGAKLPEGDARIDKLLASMPKRDDRLATAIESRRKGWSAATGDFALGLAVFKKTCAACHKVGGEGNKIGPELDGIGLRGVDRVLEDVLDPNRVVDQAFRATQIVTKDGRILLGLVLRREGEVVVLADQQGKEQRIAQADIDEQVALPMSPMPANVAEQMPEADFYHLLAFLLRQQQRPAGK